MPCSGLLRIQQQHLRRDRAGRGACHSDICSSRGFTCGCDSLKVIPTIPLLQSPAQSGRIGGWYQQHNASQRRSHPLHHRRQLPSHRRSSPQRHPCLGVLLHCPYSDGLIIRVVHHFAFEKSLDPDREVVLQKMEHQGTLVSSCITWKLCTSPLLTACISGFYERTLETIASVCSDNYANRSLSCLTASSRQHVGSPTPER